MVSESIKKKVLNYVKEHPGATDVEIAEALDLHIINVTVALLMLEEDGFVKAV